MTLKSDIESYELVIKIKDGKCRSLRRIGFMEEIEFNSDGENPLVGSFKKGDKREVSNEAVKILVGRDKVAKKVKQEKPKFKKELEHGGK